VPVIGTIHEKLGRPGFAAFRQRLQAYLDTLSGYGKNQLPELSPDVKEKVASAWKHASEEWGYPA